MNKKAITFIAIAALLLASFIPVGNSIATKENEKTIEVPVRIYTLQGIKEIRKELPLSEAIKLQKMAHESKEAMETLFNKNASFMERIRANEIIDSLLYEMKNNGLLGNLTIKEAKELITGKYLQKQKNSMEARKMLFILKLFNQNGWQVNAMCYFSCGYSVLDFFLWNFIPAIAGSLIWIFSILYLPFMILDCFPHPTTVGYWIVDSKGIAIPPHGFISTSGLFGEKNLKFKEGKSIVVTIGFTGVVLLGIIAIGFTLFTAFKKT